MFKVTTAEFQVFSSSWILNLYPVFFEKMCIYLYVTTTIHYEYEDLRQFAAAIFC